MGIGLRRTIIGVLACALIAVSAPIPAVATATDPGASSGVVAERGDGLVRLRGTHDRGDIVLRRDGSRAVPFAADLSGAPGSSSVGSSEGFDWSDAGIGAAAALFGATVFVGALVVARRGSTPLRGG